MSDAAPKIRFRWAVNVEPAFARASELRDSLLASYPDASYFGRAVVGRNRDDTAPAWGWVPDLIRMRSDWWPALGIALQHAARDGGELARAALADLEAHYRDSLAVLPWMAPIAAEWPDVKADGTGTGWGLPDFRLSAIVADQAKSLEEIRAGNHEVFLDSYGKGGGEVTGPFTSEAELSALLTETAHAGQFPDGDKGPWSWLGFELLTGGAWLRPAFVNAVSAMTAAQDGLELRALLDWFSEQRDLWQFMALFEAWMAHHPTWWDNAADAKPKGWKRTMRTAHWPNVSTLGDIVVEATGRACAQHDTPPVIDLPQLFGAPIT